MDTKAIAQRFSAADPADRRALAALAHDVDALLEAVPPADAARTGRLRAASVLAHSAARSETPVTKAELRVVAELIDPKAATDPAPEAAARSDGEHVGTELELASDLLLGEILIQRNAVSPHALEDALRLQLRTRERLGTCLLRARAVTQGQLDSALDFQVRFKRDPHGSEARDAEDLAVGRRRRQFLESVGDCLLGEVLVRLGRITHEDLERGLRVQRATGMRIGEALVDVGATTWPHVQRALEIQQQRRAS